MNDRDSFEARLAAALSAYADRAPVEVDPVSLTAATANRRPPRRWAFGDPRAAWLLAGAVLALLAMGAVLVVGAYAHRPRTAIGGGGLMIINQVDVPIGGDESRPTSEQVFAFDEATGERNPIVELPVAWSYGWMSASWSPDRKHALLFDGGGSVRGIVDLASHQLSPVQLHPGDATTSYGDPRAWGPASDRIALFVSNDTASTHGSILISDLEGREIGRLAMPPGWTAGRPTWSPDGSALILAGCRATCSDGDEQLLLFPVDGSPMRTLFEPATWYGPAVWSPDGSTIAVGSPVGIETFDVSTGREFAVTHGPDSNPAWSPDGRRIAFSRGNEMEIDVVDVDGTNLVQLTTGADDNPDWSPDGTTVVFSRQDGINPDVWVVAADGGEPRRLIENASADW